jgi:hypothetical protein
MWEVHFLGRHNLESRMSLVVLRDSVRIWLWKGLGNGVDDWESKADN